MNQLGFLRRVTGPPEAPPECYDIDVDVPMQPRDERIGGQLDTLNRDREFHAVRPSVGCSSTVRSKHISRTFSQCARQWAVREAALFITLWGAGAL